MENLRKVFSINNLNLSSNFISLNYYKKNNSININWTEFLNEILKKYKHILLFSSQGFQENLIYEIQNNSNEEISQINKNLIKAEIEFFSSKSNIKYLDYSNLFLNLNTEIIKRICDFLSEKIRPYIFVSESYKLNCSKLNFIRFLINSFVGNYYASNLYLIESKNCKIHMKFESVTKICSLDNFNLFINYKRNVILNINHNLSGTERQNEVVDLILKFYNKIR